ncbi:hypothetical protein STCU_11774 [Strigomonas culicis]|uniref:Uncharacterized protein n=1 Tax=Strigomonas culicis TaxID=28005 RepID=S9TFP2_9TRYP|nr:hypothetical protein STCU_11774 [Strigomonas culicis]|eukprot:EPY15779.1 hypothetical protein STCU_11774 [Strigomonas culicis]
MQFIVDKLGKFNSHSWSSRVFSIRNLSRSSRSLESDEEGQSGLCLFVSQKGKPDNLLHHCLIPHQLEMYPDYDIGSIYAYMMYSKDELSHIICVRGHEVKVDESDGSISSGSEVQHYRSSGLLHDRHSRKETRWLLRFENMSDLRVAAHLISSRLPTTKEDLQ